MTIFGESHGAAIGCVLDGLPAGLRLDEDFINRELQRRAPGQSALTTARKEQDAYKLQSGVFNGTTTGSPLCVFIPNGDMHSGDYGLLQNVMRPGHADFTGKSKYQGFNDYRGGGHFSGRLTAPLVFAGAVAKTLLAQRGITVGAHIALIADVADDPFALMGEQAEVLAGLAEQGFPVLNAERGAQMQAQILAAKADKDSVGGTVECMALNVPVGLGEPFFDSVESTLAHALFAVPAVKGIEFGKGFALAQLRGSEANDELYFADEQVRAYSNNNGGILGGITNGMPICFKVVLKPTPSIAKAQRTVDMAKRENTVLELQGRHDPCVVQRAVPVIEAVTAWVLLDLLLTAENGVVK